MADPLLPASLPYSGTLDLSVLLALAKTFAQLSRADQFIALTVNGAIPIGPPLVASTFQITKAGVLAETLAAPVAGAGAAGDDGKLVWVFSTTANAHTVTATGLYQSGSASVNLATFAAFAGAGMLLMALNGKWIVVYSVGVTFS